MNPTAVYLTQTDTTVGFLSQDKSKLSKLKNRDENKEFIISADSFKTLKTFTRIPQKFKKMIRRAKKITIVYPNNLAVRVVKDPVHLNFLKKIKWAYSTSANESSKSFDEAFAKKKADVILYDKFGFFEKNPSKIVNVVKYQKGG